MTVLRVCYKHGVRFDEGYYTTKHLPWPAASMGPHGLRRVEMVKFTATADGGTPQYQMQFSAYFDSPTALQSALQDPRIGEVLGDIQKFYDGMPDMLIGEVASLLS